METKEKQQNLISINCTSEDQYSEKIGNLLTGMVGKSNIIDNREILNLMENALYADSHIRFGPKPELEDRVYVRSVITSYMNENRPIPILVPWGSIKTKFGANIDIAEFMAIKQLVHLTDRVKEIYEPGVEIILRIEDTSGYELFKLEDKDDLLFAGTNLYSNNLKELITVLDTNYSIFSIKESVMKGADEFNQLSNYLTPLFEDYLLDSNDIFRNPSAMTELAVTKLCSYLNLVDQGWKGIISLKQRNHYYTAYNKLYNGDTELMTKRLAMYFAGSLTRHRLNMTGKQASWNHGFIQISVVPPIAGLPKGYNSNYIYYRTVPENYTRLHMPPWRAKGYIAISDKGTLSMKPKLATWNEEKNYHTNSFVISSKDGEVKIQSDYILT